MRLLKLPRILSLTLVMLLMLTLSSCIWGVEAPFKLSPVDYLGYLEDETPEGIKISGKLDSSVSCVLTIKNSSKYDYSFYGFYALYRWIDGEWLPVKKSRNAGDAPYIYPTAHSGEEATLIYNWDYEYGELGKGSYKLVTACHEPETNSNSLVSFDFKLPSRPFSNKPRDEYGYLSVGDSKDLSMAAERISPHRFRLDIRKSGKITYMFDRSFALYYKSGSKWQPVEQKIDQPGRLLDGGYPGYDGKYSLSLSPFYGALPAGDYLIVKRGLPSGEPFILGRPVSDYSYVSAEFHLEEELKEAEYEPELFDWLGWYEDSAELDEIISSVTNLTAEGCTINMVNIGEGHYETGKSSPVRLYRLVDNEWYPVKQHDYMGDGLIPINLPPQGEVSLDEDWSYIIGRLSPGTYRLVKKFTIKNDKGRIIKQNLLKSWEFVITDEMAAIKSDNPYGYTADSPLLEDAILTVEKLNSHRFKADIIRDGDNIGSDLSFALYEEKDGGWHPVPCKYDILRFYYSNKEGFYPLMTHNYGNQIIDITALYGSLKPGSYRLVKRYSGGRLFDEFKYVTADFVYTGY